MAEFIRQAEKALRTGQPRLAELYMRRGLSGSWQGRAWLFGYDLGLWGRPGGTQADFALVAGARK